MGRTVAIGIQDFRQLILDNCFYVDKTLFIKDWWESRDSVTLITRPRRFGKTLTMSMVEQFFCVTQQERSNVFDQLEIWQYADMREIYGKYPVISLSFANVKEKSFEMTKKKICELIVQVYINYEYVLEDNVLQETEVSIYKRMINHMDEVDATLALNHLSRILYKYYGKKVIILLDEYDTPMQEAYIDGYWDELASFMRGLFNAAFKTNPALERGLMTGITRVSKESIFSDLNNLEVITTTSEKYAASFGFTEKEVLASLEEYGLGNRKEQVKAWYDGFTFGIQKDMYNPWSIINFLDKAQLNTYWANTSGNRLVSELVQKSNRDMKQAFEDLLNGKTIICELDEQIVYDQLYTNENAIWSLMLASGYLKVVSFKGYEDLPEDMAPQYELAITNYETKRMFDEMIKGWFAKERTDYNDFIKAMFLGDVAAMNGYMNRIALEIFSFFDTGKRASGSQPERFYHGFVLGLLVELREQYYLRSNRESGFGRYDILLEPKNRQDIAVILEFKVRNLGSEKSLEETVNAALRQIEEMQYQQELLQRGIQKKQIKCYGIAFEGKQVLIGKR